MRWKLTNDTLSVPGPSLERLEGVYTKRGVLQATASIYDPLGFFSPTTLQAKIFIKELWENKFEWDTELPTELLARWKTICDDLKAIPTFPICNNQVCYRAFEEFSVTRVKQFCI